jgi:uncharacterized protein (UPF0332 family)
MQPRDFHQTAAELAAHGRRPADFRSAISRAYYATYHTALELLKAMGFSPDEGWRAHTDVRDYLNNSGDPQLIELAGTLANLHGRRKDADYKLSLEYVNKQAVATAAVQQADKAIYNLVARCNSAQRSTIIAAIKKWKSSS